MKTSIETLKKVHCLIERPAIQLLYGILNAQVTYTRTDVHVGYCRLPASALKDSPTLSHHLGKLMLERLVKVAGKAKHPPDPSDKIQLYTTTLGKDLLEHLEMIHQEPLLIRIDWKVKELFETQYIRKTIPPTF